jgi:hypothetical protein
LVEERSEERSENARKKGVGWSVVEGRTRREGEEQERSKANKSIAQGGG